MGGRRSLAVGAWRMDGLWRAERACTADHAKPGLANGGTDRVERQPPARGRRVDIAIGLKLAERSGVAARELPVTRAELEAGRTWVGDVPLGSPDEMFSCETLGRLPKHLAAVAQRGEWGVIQEGLRARQAASAQTVTKP